MAKELPLGMAKGLPLGMTGPYAILSLPKGILSLSKDLGPQTAAFSKQ
jgi:hypothetical protein